MADSITISPLPPEEKSMQYELLRAQGLQYIQDMASNLWTDYNVSDPGISILEVLSYVINDLGYRVSYSIPDLLAQNPALAPEDIRNFFTARQILPMRPVTYNDYRKLIIDVEVKDASGTAGVKNAWIEKSPDNEIPVYIDRLTQNLSYIPADPNQPEKLDIRFLYDILLEFDRSETFGDLNENTLEKRIKLYPCAPSMLFPPLNTKLINVSLKIEVEFPRWDDPDVDWNDISSIRQHLKNITLDFSGLQSGFKVEGYGFLPDKSIWLDITENNVDVDTQCIVSQIENVLYNPAGSLLIDYQKKVKKVLEIVAKVRATLMDNRNLGEDFFRISALKVEEIAVCADIQVSAIANIEEVLAQVYFQIGNFLSPTVYFYTIDQMYEKGYRTEEIFEGPPLEHGFIDTNELKNADRKKSIHVSDLINIIMDIPGVEAVKSIQIANIPLDNDQNIESVSAKWCLQLAFDKNYVPRLSTERSNITFFKGLLPYQANEEKVDALLEELLDNQRPQKLHDIPLDLPVPQGTFRDTENYVSVQDEFPLNYGIGPDGLPSTSSDMRKAQARQLKGFLMFFDQLLADYFSQLAHVKDLFSMNDGINAGGDFDIDKTYFSQSLVPYVTDANDLLTNPVTYPLDLQNLTETETLFESRRNRFLDHLMARFCEQFTDYALLMYKIDGPKAPKELIEDKLRMLNNYPVISSDRFRAFNYESPCEIWNIDNTSGLEKRISLLTGIDPREASDIQIGTGIDISGSPLTIKVPAITPIFESWTGFATMDEAKLAAERLIVNGVNEEKYQLVDSNGKIFSDPTDTYLLPLRIAIVCGDEILAVYGALYSVATAPVALALLPTLRNTVLPVFENEYYNNFESNRNNLSIPFDNYYKVGTVNVNMVPDPPQYFFDFSLYKNPFDFTPGNEIMNGTFTGYGNCKSTQAIVLVDPGTYKITVDGDLSPYITGGDPITIAGSADNDGDYTVLSIVAGGIPIQTVIELDGTPTLTTTLPLGELRYNQQTVAELTQIGIDHIEEALFEVSQRGIDPANYTFTDYVADPPYRFNIANRCDETMATSVESNFNSALAALVLSHNSPTPNIFRIVNSTFNNGVYTANTAVAQGSEIKIEVAEGLASLVSDGEISFPDSINITSVDPGAHQVVVSGNYSRIIFPGQAISISGYLPEDYTVKDSYSDGTNSYLIVNERIEATIPSAIVQYQKVMEITRVELNTLSDDVVYVKGGADDYAVKQMADFIRGKFFSHEGLHLVEHVLLRPKHNGNFFIDFDHGGQELQTGLSPLGTFDYMKKLPVFAVDLVNNMFFVNGDITTEVAPLSEIIIKGSEDALYDNKYKVLTVGLSGMQTGIKVYPNIPDAIVLTLGDINYRHSVSITSNTTTEVVIPVPDTEIAIEFPMSITGSQSNINDGFFVADSATGSPSATVELSARQTLVKDELMQVNLMADCETCAYSDPYSFIISVIMPGWQGRFANNDFRAFFNRSLRLECPAHLVMNICWISNEQMTLFEKAYKRWLIENSKKVKKEKALSDALNDLITIMSQLRSNYPKGTLHDCALDDTLTNAIILNQTILGTT